MENPPPIPACPSLICIRVYSLNVHIQNPVARDGSKHFRLATADGAPPDRLIDGLARPGMFGPYLYTWTQSRVLDALTNPNP